MLKIKDTITITDNNDIIHNDEGLIGRIIIVNNDSKTYYIEKCNKNFSSAVFSAIKKQMAGKGFVYGRGRGGKMLVNELVEPSENKIDTVIASAQNNAEQEDSVLLRITEYIYIDKDFNVIRDGVGVAGKIIIDDPDKRIFHIKRYSSGILDSRRTKLIIEKMKELGYINRYHPIKSEEQFIQENEKQSIQENNDNTAQSFTPSQSEYPLKKYIDRLVEDAKAYAVYDTVNDVVKNIVNDSINNLMTFMEEKEKARTDALMKIFELIAKELGSIKQTVSDFTELREIVDFVDKINSMDEKSKELIFTVLELKKNIA